MFVSRTFGSITLILIIHPVCLQNFLCITIISFCVTTLDKGAREDFYVEGAARRNLASMVSVSSQNRSQKAFKNISEHAIYLILYLLN